MAENDLPGWLVEVDQGLPGSRTGMFAVLAREPIQAEGLVRDHIRVTSQRVQWRRVLSKAEVAGFGLKPGEVKECAP